MCPALDTSTGRCEVYEWRRLACRAMGPPVRLRGADLAPCPYCFGPASPGDVERCRATPDPDGQEGVLLAELQSRGEPTARTLIPFALLQDPEVKVAGHPKGLPE